MISEDEKLRIRELEAFRKDVRDQLSPTAPKSRSDRLWAALNSNFGMWLVSAVLVSGLGTAYTRYTAQKEDERKQAEVKRSEDHQRVETNERLRLEFAFRVSSAMARLAALHRATALKSGSTADATMVDRALDELRLPRGASSPPLFVEYTTFTALTVLADLRRLSPDAERRILKTVLNRTSRVVESSSSSTDRSPLNVAREILEYTRPVVSGTGFPYTDCEEKTPFC